MSRDSASHFNVVLGVLSRVPFGRFNSSIVDENMQRVAFCLVLVYHVPDRPTADKPPLNRPSILASELQW